MDSSGDTVPPSDWYDLLIETWKRDCWSLMRFDPCFPV